MSNFVQDMVLLVFFCPKVRFFLMRLFFWAKLIIQARGVLDGCILRICCLGIS